MMTDVAASQLRVGLIGLGRPGLHLIERFAAGGPFRIAAAFDASTTAEVVSQFGVRLATDFRELLAATDIDVIWISESWGLRKDFALPDVLATKHAILETPFGVTSAVLGRAFQVAHQRGRQLVDHIQATPRASEARPGSRSPPGFQGD